jgi:hypothetical protein
VGCDSVITLNLTVNQPSTSTISQTICAPNSFSFNGQALSSTGTYLDTLTNAVGCDSVITLNLTVNQPSTSTISQTICAPNNYSFNGQALSSTGTYLDTLTNAVGCDSVITLNLTVNQPSASTISQTICSPNSYTFNGQSYSTSGTYTVTLTNAVGCDSLVTLNLTVNQSSTSVINRNICLGDSVVFQGQAYTSTGTHSVTFTNAAGCDSVVTLNLNVSPNLGDSVASISIGVVQGIPGATVSVPVVAGSLSGVTSFQFGVYYDSSVLAYQNIRLGSALLGQTVIPSPSGNRVDVAFFDFSGTGLTVCSDTLYWIDFTYSSQGGLSPLVWDYTGTLVSGPGGTVLSDVRLGNGLVYGASVTTSVPVSNGNQRLCEFSDALFTVTGTGISAYQWMVSTNGGGSFVNLSNGIGIRGAQSDSLILESVIASMNGNLYMCVVQGAGGTVASLVQRLQVQASASVSLGIVVSPSGSQCAGTPVSYSAAWSGSLSGIAYTWTVNGQPAGTNSVLVRSDLQDGDVVGLEVIATGSCEVGSASVLAQVNALPQGYVVSGGGSICPGALGHGVTLSGSDLGVRYALLLNGISTGDTLIGTGGVLNFGLRTAAGTYTVEARNTVGCSSLMAGFAQVTALPGVVGTVTASTTIFLGQSVQLLATGGVSYQWSPSTGLSSDVLPNPVATPQATTTYSVVITNLQGCSDTLEVVITVLPVQPVSAGPDTVVCINADTVRLTGAPAGGSWSGSGIVSGTQGLFVASIAGIGTHDVVYTVVTAGISTADTLRITVRDISIPGIINHTICAPSGYNFNGQSYSASGTYTATLTNSVGCDSVITLNLTVNQPSTSTISQTICAPNSFTFNGQSYSTSGTYTATLTNSVGCDSVITLNLVVNQPSASTISQTICAPNSFSFNGQSYSTTGTYTATLTNAEGCDSVITLNLTVNQSNNTIITDSICAGTNYLFNGQSLGTPGIYIDTLSNSVGCDSIVTLNLYIVSCEFSIGARVFIEGFYRTNSASMVPLLYNLSLSTDSNATDSIIVSLWDSTNLLNPYLSFSGIVNKYGFIFIQLPASILNRSFYISINHRNSFEVWSSNLVRCSDSAFYDFTISDTSAYGNGLHSPMKLLPDGRYAMYSGDVNQDGIIDAQDLDIVWLTTGSSPINLYYTTDLNADEIPDAQDIDILWLNSLGSLLVSRPR